MKNYLLLIVLLFPIFAHAETIEKNGIYYNIITTGQIAEVIANPNKYSGDIELPSSFFHDGVEYSVARIADDAFRYCSSLKSIIIPNSVTSIGERAFWGCENLSSIDIPNSVTSIKENTFSFCSALISIDIPNSVTSIGAQVFLNCSALISIDIPNSVTSINYSAFCGCTSLSSVKLPNTITSLEYYLFKNCSSLTSIDIPNSVTSIGGFSGETFLGCSSLKSIIIPESVQSIARKTFYNCNNLETVYCYRSTPPKLDATAFENSYIEYDTLYVPKDAVSTYKSHSQWGKFGTILPIENEENKEKCSSPNIYFNNGELSFICDTENAVINYSYSLSTNVSGKAGKDTIKPEVTLIVKAWATADGFDPSDTATSIFDINISKLGKEGDVNKDGKVDISDIVSVINIIAKE